MHVSSIRTALANVFQIPLRLSPLRNALPAISSATTKTSSSHFSTSPILAKKKKGGKPEKRITLIRYFLHHPTTLTPRPLRFSRNRYLRHWTIHRAWNLYQAKLKQARQLELERQYNAMNAANEELRIGVGDGGRLFRKAQMKTGIWSIPERGGGVPIEYARGLVEWMGSTGGLGSGGTGLGAKAKIWDYGWKR
ncbi:uncharacterized protein Z518_06854 [Rhinocladiella mackenziei CBS 650.93]|uniref:Large ribosomal subunit protein mL40 n=1 Tax=Rhinocladiella mackenziei CBS 650.93 TaxID=1442369 RepID=A0A0D2FMP5_9EURO|nr:uncharacterized protein Z518_06854 [Rhinocladiella mackenziei CBS 650.93]KIX03302.1 hypothetical protein Z518_06854 [Rhinocladiella mackenziei CBS 650.93]